MDYPVLVIPGHGNSGPLHWQSLWQQWQPGWARIEVGNWDHAICDDWVSAIDREVAGLGENTLLVAHSLGCLAVAHWAIRHSTRVRGALLVAVPDPSTAAFPSADTVGFSPLPLARLPFPSTVVASSNDPYAGIAYARSCAEAWGSEFVEIGARGHINAASGLDDWPDGYRLLQNLAAPPA
jgi:predicted alpha/beta hydrolase family esterase